MGRAMLIVACLAVALGPSGSTARAQVPMVGMTVGAGFGYGGYAPFGVGYGGWGYGGFAPGWGAWGGYGPGVGFVPYGLGYGGYGALAYNQQAFRQQALLTQGIFLQQQQALLGQIDQAEARLEKLDGVKQQLFKRYLDMNDTDKAAVRGGLIVDYLRLDAAGRDGWKRDAVVQRIIGQDVWRLDGVAEYRAMNPAEQASFRTAMLEQYRLLTDEQQRVWQNDQIVGLVMGRNWWQP